MRCPVAFWVLLVAVASLGAAEKKLPIEQTSNELIDISATALLDKDQIRQELGSDLGGDIVVVRVTVRPVSEKPVQLSLNDFLLVSAKDGQRSEPYAPSQIAGSATLVVTPLGGVKRGGLGSNPNGPVWGGVPGTGTQPQRLPGSGGNVGNSGAAPTEGESKVENTSTDKPNPLLAVLNDKVLPEKEIKDSVSGLLYFQMIGKVKSKDLELHYKGPAGRLALRFHP